MIIFALLLLTSCSSQDNMGKDTPINEQPLSEWVKLENNEKNNLMIEAFKEAGLEKKEWDKYFRMAINEINKAATQQENRNVPIQKALEVQVQNVKALLKNQE
jgi:hypothetical protein